MLGHVPVSGDEMIVTPAFQGAVEEAARTILAELAGNGLELARLLPRTTKPPASGGFSQADERTRTLDLLHGKDVARADRRWREQADGVNRRVSAYRSRPGVPATVTQT